MIPSLLIGFCKVCLIGFASLLKILSDVIGSELREKKTSVISLSLAHIFMQA